MAGCYKTPDGVLEVFELDGRQAQIAWEKASALVIGFKIASSIKLMYIYSLDFIRIMILFGIRCINNGMETCISWRYNWSRCYNEEGE